MYGPCMAIKTHHFPEPETRLWNQIVMKNNSSTTESCGIVGWTLLWTQLNIFCKYKALYRAYTIDNGCRILILRNELVNSSCHISLSKIVCWEEQPGCPYDTVFESGLVLVLLTEHECRSAVCGTTLSWLRFQRTRPVCISTMCDLGALADSTTLPEVSWPSVVTNTSVL